MTECYNVLCGPEPNYGLVQQPSIGLDLWLAWPTMTDFWKQAFLFGKIAMMLSSFHSQSINLSHLIAKFINTLIPLFKCTGFPWIQWQPTSRKKFGVRRRIKLIRSHIIISSNLWCGRVHSSLKPLSGHYPRINSAPGFYRNFPSFHIGSLTSSFLWQVILVSYIP